MNKNDGLGLNLWAWGSGISPNSNTLNSYTERKSLKNEVYPFFVGSSPIIGILEVRVVPLSTSDSTSMVPP